MKNRFDFIMLVVLVILGVGLAVLAYSFGGVDFGVYYAAAKVTLQGGNPYDYQQLAPQIVSNAGKLNNPYYYAPWFTWSVLPFALFPYAVARGLWAFVNFVIWFIALHLLSKTVDYPAGATRWGIWLFATAIFAWSTWGSEQVGVLIFFLITLVFHFASRKNWMLVGVLLALLLFKPNITAIPAGFIAIWFLLREKTWKPILAMSVTLLALIVLSVIVSPQWYVALFDADKLQGLSYTLDSSGGTEIKRLTTTLRDFLAAYGIAGGSGLVIQSFAALAAIFSVGYAIRRADSLLEFSSIILLANFAVIPYALFYDYPPLTISLFYGNVLSFKEVRYKWLRYAMHGLIGASLFVGDGIPYRYWIEITLVCFLGTALYIKGRQISTSTS